jgi:MerR family transcriptional regulator, redox-sensitive transcriptional activator SoxR
MTVGTLARQAGLRPSAVRYYERVGVLPAPPRRSGRRDYGPDALGQLAVVQFARACGFTLTETRQLVRGFSPATAASVRWKTLAAAKQREMDTIIDRAKTMKGLLDRISACRCETLAQCGEGLLRRRGGRGVG